MNYQIAVELEKHIGGLGRLDLDDYSSCELFTDSSLVQCYDSKLVLDGLKAGKKLIFNRLQLLQVSKCDLMSP